MDFITTINQVIEWIPRIVETVRTPFANSMGLYYLIAVAVGLIGAYYLLKQFIVGKIFMRISYYLIALFIYVSLVYLRV